MGSDRLRRSVKTAVEEAGGYVSAMLEQLGRVLPPRLLLRLDGFIGTLLRPAARKPRGIAMMKAFLGAGSRTKTEWEEIWQRHVRMVGRLALRHILSFRTPVAELRAELEVCGAEHINAALNSGKGTVLLCSHTGNFMGQLVLAGSLGREAWAFGNQLLSSRAEERFTRFHRKVGVDRMLVGRGHSRAASDLLNRGGVVVTFCDLTTVPRDNAWIPFGQTETLVNLGPALLGLRNQAPLVVVTSRLLSDGRTAVSLHRILPMVRTGDLLWDAYRVACQAMVIVTAEVQNFPEQWWQWDIGRYRTADGQGFGNLAPFEIHDFGRAVPCPDGGSVSGS